MGGSRSCHFRREAMAAGEPAMGCLVCAQGPTAQPSETPAMLKIDGLCIYVI
jgi:hypothetical protein